MSNLLKKILKQDDRVLYSHFKIERKGDGRILIIPDIHGSPKTLLALIQKLNLTKNDYLFFLGDYIDKGIDSIGVVDIILELIKNDYNVFPIKGNHEQELIETYLKWGLIKIYDFDFDEDDYEESEIEEFLNFIFNLPVYYIIDNLLIVHAGLNFEAENHFLDFENMLWMRKPVIPKDDFKYKIIHGHTPTELSEIECSIEQNKQVINLDNGCFYIKKDSFGSLICFDVDKSFIYRQKNIDDVD